MQNLQKYTKAELISKLKNKNNSGNNNNNQSGLHSVVDNLLLFKSLILKITLIAFIIRWIKKYSLVQKLWHIFSMIGSTLLGFSLFDIYSLDLLNWIKDTSIYKWYYGLFNTPKIEKIEETIPSFMRTVHPETTTIESENEKVKEQWAEGTSSPDSTSSTETITPANVDKCESSNLSPLLYISQNWKELWPSDIKEKIKILDELWDTDEETWTREIGEKLVTTLAYLENRYNSEVKVYKSLSYKLTISQINEAKQNFYYFREYLHTFHSRILSNYENKIIVGKLNDDIEILDFV